ncbi:hypothetical protein GCM10009544_47130 [Streptomyces stramineus]|uniref:Uncharacterized protein n=1 Tax=Streptomyces stramineus TaxID=173861 RepID=A0ABN1ALV8_9ACTN
MEIGRTSGQGRPLADGSQKATNTGKELPVGGRKAAPVQDRAAAGVVERIAQLRARVSEANRAGRDGGGRR